jgi:putative spermidine/putrescine transport system permease protein
LACLASRTRFAFPAAPAMEKTILQPHPGLIGGQELAPESLAALKRKQQTGFPTLWLIAPATLWLLLFLVIPLLSIIVFSFWKYSGHGMEPSFTLENYRDFFNSSIYITTFLTTLRYTVVVMGVCLLLGYPIAFFLAMQVQSFKWQMSLFLLCMVPFWTSYLIRAVAWIPMLGRQGLLNNLLLSLGIVDEPVSFLLYSEFGLTMALVQLYVVLCIGPIFFSLAKIDKAILEAARDMGANGFQIFREIVLPLSLPGIAIGMIFVFVMVMGEFATAGVVGGGKTAMVGNVILNLMGIAQYPFAAVNALMLMVGMMIGVIVILKLVDIRREL